MANDVFYFVLFHVVLLFLYLGQRTGNVIYYFVTISPC